MNLKAKKEDLRNAENLKKEWEDYLDYVENCKYDLKDIFGEIRDYE